MKKIILTFIALTVLFSCGGNDDEIQSGILGKWNKYKETKEYQDGNIEEVNLSNCDLKEILELKSNNVVILTRYLGSNCEDSKLIEGVFSYDESNNELTLPNNNKQIVEVIGNEMNFKFTVTGINNYIKTIYFKRID